MKGHIRKRSGNAYELTYELPRDANGKRRQGHKTVHGSKKEAEASLRAILTSLDTGNYITPTQETVGVFLGRWLNTYAATRTTVRTQMAYRSIIRAYLSPTLGSTALAALKPEHIQGVYSALLARDLSPQTVLHAHRVLHRALASAVKEGSISRNVCDSVDAPKAPKREMSTLDVDGIQRLFEAAEDSPCRDAFYVALYTGVRRSELLALQWNNIDLVNNRLSVVAGLHFITGKGLVLLPTKTKRSRRAVTFTQEVTDVFRAIQGAQLVSKAELGEIWQDTGFVFTKPDGTPMDPARVTRAFAAVMKKAGISGVRLHDLRHTHASLMLIAGVHAKVVSERMGHANIGITMDTYSHVLPGLQEDAADKFAEVVRDAR
jgi:integrase